LGHTVGWNKLLVALTAILAAANIGYVIYAGKQFGIMNGQLQQMESGGRQTDTMLSLMQQELSQITRQAGDTHELAVQAKNQADRTKDIADRTIQEVAANQKAAAAAKSASETAKDSLRISQGASVTIGNKDGVVADFVIPKEPDKKVEIVIFFQNTGHVPARFSWSLEPAFGSGPAPSGIEYTHPNLGMAGMLLLGMQSKKPGLRSRQPETTSTTIGGGSTYISTLGQISKEGLDAPPYREGNLIIFGSYEYCDDLGNWVGHTFAIKYRNNAPISSLSFNLEFDTEMPWMNIPPDSDTTHYYIPCKNHPQETRGAK
jgi:hypothetical protein